MSFEDPTQPRQPNPYMAGIQNPGARRQAFTSDRPVKEPERPDVLASYKWHETALEAHPENHFFTSTKADHMGVVNAIDQLDHLMKARDPRVTPAAHQDRVNADAERAAKRLDDKFKAVAMRNIDSLKQMEQVVHDRLGISEDSRHGMEIRGKLASLSNDERRQAIHEAAANGDREVMAAVLNGPGFLTGLSADEKARMFDSYMRRHEPTLAAEMDAMKRSAEKLEAATAEAGTFIRRHYINHDHDPAARKADEARARYDDVLRNL